VCDRIGIFVAGKLRACGTVDELAATLDDRWAFSVGLADVDDARALLTSLKGVKRVDRSEGRWTITADRDVRVPLHDAVSAAGGRFTHLSRDRADLDAIYHRYFGHADDGAAL
jgi:ABC-2 type transport system ATP-binding protein